MKRYIKASVNWNYFNKFDTISEQYLPDTGEGDTMASQIVTAVSKLVYKYYNDGDVYDNSCSQEFYPNDLSSYANWLYKYVPDTRTILNQALDCYSKKDYENILKQLADVCMDFEFLSKFETPAQGSIYHCQGPFAIVDYNEEEW